MFFVLDGPTTALEFCYVLGLMTPEETRMKQLIEQISVEKDQEKFIDLVRELNDLLERKEKSLEPKYGTQF